jgi:hypothetical protein
MKTTRNLEKHGKLLDFWVASKVFTPCLGVLHEIWGKWFIFSPWMVQDGF